MARLDRAVTASMGFGPATGLELVPAGRPGPNDPTQDRVPRACAGSRPGVSGGIGHEIVEGPAVGVDAVDDRGELLGHGAGVGFGQYASGHSGARYARFRSCSRMSH